MKSILRLSFIICMLLSACKSEKTMDDLPLSMDKLVKVMTDAYLAEAAIQNYTPDIKDSLSTSFYGQIYELHEITQEELDGSLDIIENYPDMMDTLYTRINRYLLELEEQ